MLRLRSGFLSALAALAAVPALAQEGMPLLDVEYESPQRYDPFEGANTVTEFTVLVERPTGFEQHYLEIEAAAGGLLGFQREGQVLPVFLRSPENGTFAQGTLLRLRLPTAQETSTALRATIRLLAEAGRVVTPGRYEALLDIRLTDGADIAAELLAVPIPLEVPGRAQVVIAGSSGSFDPARSVSFIDFGELETGERRDLFAIVRANTDTRITVSSMNDGYLRQPAAPQVPGVPYSVVFDGTPSDLRAPLRLTRSPARTRSGTSYPFAVIIGSADGAFAGEYVDEVTIAVAPQ